MKTNQMLLLAFTMVIVLAGCKKKNSDPEVVYNTANAQVKGVNYAFKTTSSFGKFCIIAGVCNTFGVDPNVTSKNAIMIGLPKTVKAGVTYTSDSSATQIMYIDNDGRQFYSTWGDSLSITVTKWEGHNGYGAGTFSGKLRYSADNAKSIDSVYVKNGTFSSRIWYVIN